MDIKQRIRSIFGKITGCRCASDEQPENKSADCESGAEHVIKKEIFPDERKKSTRQPTIVAHKKPSKRTRPTNGNYTMIDKDNNTCDRGKS